MKNYILLSVFSLFILWAGCKKDKNDPPQHNVQVTTADVQVTLPAGSSLDLSKTRVFTLAGSSNVGADGKTNVPFLAGSGQLAFLFDQSDNLLLASYITSDNKDISVKTTAQVLLFNGLQYSFLPDSVKLDFLKKSATSSRLSDYYSKMEQTFRTDYLALEKRSFAGMLSETILKLTTQNPVSIYGKQVHIVDDDIKSKLQINEVDVENVEILNHTYRRAHAFVYKTAFRNQQGLETVLLSNIDYDDAAEKNMLVKKVRYTPNAFDMIDVWRGFKTAETGPINLPVASNEMEATYKIRILGPGKPVGTTLTNAEKTKLEELYYEYLAYDILAPLLLDAMGYKSLIARINEEALKPFAEKVKIVAKTDPSIMEDLRAGVVHRTTQRFFDAITTSGQSTVLLSTSLIECMKASVQNTNISLPSQQTLQDHEIQMNKGLELLKYATGVVTGEFILAPHSYYNEMEEFEVKSRDNNVKITPEESSVSTYVNHPLSAKASVELSANQTIWYKWITPGKYGGLRIGTSGQASPTLETDQAAINYYSNATASQLGEDNYETIYVTAYIKEGSALTAVGTDTATVNVKKNKLVMKPDDAAINLKNGGSKSLRLYIVKSDGTRDILPNPVIDYKVVWSTAGSYGSLENNTKSVTKYDDNSAVYTAFDDDDITKVTENITARVYFKTKGETQWMLREEVKGKVTIENDEKKIIYYTSPTSIHSDRNGKGCAVGCAVIVPPVADAKSYSVYVTGLSNKNYPTYSDSWNASDTDYVRGYAGYVYTSNAEAKGKYVVGVYGTFTWAGGPTNEHFNIPNCTGTAKVTIILK
ncbi:MAG TPA: hypothetical protein VL098_13880 [Flavipsychrobacter sp.]|nr:hypothetical protein [Flavipsychrobacter sp.]